MTHDTTIVHEICDAAIWLNAGQLVASGSADAVVEKYLAAAERATTVAMTGPAGATCKSR